MEEKDMFREVRRVDRKLDNDMSVELIKNGEYGILSTVGEDGYPYGVPVNYIYIDNVIYFHCAVEGQKLENIKNNDKVSFCVVGKTEVVPEKFTSRYESIIAFGKAEQASGEECFKAFLGILEKYSPQYLEKGREYIKNAETRTKIIKITIEHMTGKANK
jgi:nitroimidazol reductase NimA-like FMN-containing flavoprotein (pyridoxamine 5'-phosphate oxidase superfamily)